MLVPAIFYGHCCESPVKPTHQVGRFYHMTFQNCHIAAIGEKNRQVCPHQSMEKIACDEIRCDQRIESPGVSLALVGLYIMLSGVCRRGPVCLVNFYNHETLFAELAHFTVFCTSKIQPLHLSILSILICL